MNANYAKVAEIVNAGITGWDTAVIMVNMQEDPERYDQGDIHALFARI